MSQSDAASFPVVFTSLSTILLCFFVYLNTMTKGASTQSTEIASAIQQNFGVSKPPALDTSTLRNEFSLSLSTDIEALGFQLKKQEEELVVLLPHESVFLPNSAELSAQSIQPLTKLSTLLLTRKEAISLDNWQQTDSAESWPLALEQLATLVRLFVDSGIPPKRLRPRAHPYGTKSGAPAATVSLDVAPRERR